MYPLIKRLFDIVASSVALIIFSPLMIVITVLVKMGSEGPALYRGTRASRGGGTFKMLKFRTMVMNAEKIGGPSSSADDPRITRVGAWLRRYKLDELPQLINVFKGDMSFVGPRPEVLSEVENYTPEERKLLTVRPGITDWASIKFNDEGEILKGSADPHQAYLEKIRPEKVRLGLEYVSNQSLLVDIRIIMETLVTIFKTRAASTDSP
ncbi:MAG TPA: sugar transferase [Pyrinomonadaceae bacterium]|nr:sugar transferase [Pyrinomonadaceae bacterium]